MDVNYAHSATIARKKRRVDYADRIVFLWLFTSVRSIGLLGPHAAIKNTLRKNTSYVIALPLIVTIETTIHTQLSWKMSTERISNRRQPEKPRGPPHFGASRGKEQSPPWHRRPAGGMRRFHRYRTPSDADPHNFDMEFNGYDRDMYFASAFDSECYREK